MLSSVLKRDISIDSGLASLLSIATFAFLTALGSFIRIPLGYTPVPLTLQTFFVLLGAMVLGSKRAVVSQSLFVGLGLFGIPIFAGSLAGFAYLFSPTGGYLLGFVLASFFLGYFAKKFKDHSYVLIFASIVASFIILSLGSSWLVLGYHFSIKQAFLLGFLPFCLGDVLKSIMAVCVFSVFFRK